MQKRRWESWAVSVNARLWRYCCNRIRRLLAAINDFCTSILSRSCRFTQVWWRKTITLLGFVSDQCAGSILGRRESFRSFHCNCNSGSGSLDCIRNGDIGNIAECGRRRVICRWSYICMFSLDTVARLDAATHTVASVATSTATSMPANLRGCACLCTCVWVCEHTYETQRACFVVSVTA